MRFSLCVCLLIVFLAEGVSGDYPACLSSSPICNGSTSTVQVNHVDYCCPSLASGISSTNNAAYCTGAGNCLPPVDKQCHTNHGLNGQATIIVSQQHPKCLWFVFRRLNLCCYAFRLIPHCLQSTSEQQNPAKHTALQSKHVRRPCSIQMETVICTVFQQSRAPSSLDMTHTIAQVIRIRLPQGYLGQLHAIPSQNVLLYQQPCFNRRELQRPCLHAAHKEERQQLQAFNVSACFHSP